ncbi:ribonuclease p complex subunit [Sporothrix brasiliensis 5110]|uniref:Ribonuclease P protein subunit n=1 Tax=Sporothrix brasiliensis 5110 TaxID=1398154 RepID=A0A0C2ITA3_9PEZI|nr:ribonuclease p complex subunit [Sporothrix brasiliensis 5110]KIH92311.1 ribonuclease p complex subunit [Sporothrix brasiliensis 5110]
MATPTRGALHRLLERAHSPDTANQIFTEKIQHREQFLRPASPGREERAERAANGGSAATTTSAAAASLAAAAAANTAAELAAAGASGHNGRDARRRNRRIKQEQRQNRAKTLKPKPLSSRQRREIEAREGKEGKGVGKGKRKAQKVLYSTFVPLHRLWLGYIREVLSPQELRTGGASAAAKLTAADFHGALVEVTRSACVGRVGTRGIVLRDTRFVFEIVTAANEVKMVPKDGSFFRVEIPIEEEDGGGKAVDGSTEPATAAPAPAAHTPTLVIEILGSQFMHRAADRAGRKFKQHFYKEL